ncbi:leucine-rich repeat-containing protein kinase family protein [Filimonas effusa]|uniref:Protein kinase n=1 Tax=Filimonas effusa TaxID=2508721 RepID=A0A4Q1DEG2_9BACT|nr:leucine-rich repeat-containing protein kinase family protein [Filimonas effusa]RXK87305.1 protein kinase [Filimonas effusa]
MQTLEQLLSGQLKGIKRLKLSCDLTEFPEAIFDLAESLEILDLSGNRLSALPSHFGLLKNLKIAFFSNNLFTELPAVLAACPRLEMIGFKANKIAVVPSEALSPQLRWLILTDNCIETLPASIGSCRRLQKCMLAGNRLQQLPPEMANCSGLELLRISANNIEVLPEWLFQLPRLSWLAIAGNPCCTAERALADLPGISWDDLAVTVQLGEGASGWVSHAIWRNGAMETAVAVKLFKGQVTSDGSPDEEMKIAATAGRHPHLVQVLGNITGHPEAKQGLVFELIPDSCKLLGNPPSFDSCTRDTFPEDAVFSLRQLLTIAQAITSAAAHLHAAGIMHGDLYCHNTLVNEEGLVLLTDYGAACLYQGAHPGVAAALQRIEVRAFGCFVDDLLQRLAPGEADKLLATALRNIVSECMVETVLLRPDFNGLTEKLRLIAGRTDE